MRNPRGPRDKGDQAGSWNIEIEMSMIINSMHSSNLRHPDQPVTHRGCLRIIGILAVSFLFHSRGMLWRSGTEYPCAFLRILQETINTPTLVLGNYNRKLLCTMSTDRENVMG